MIYLELFWTFLKIGAFTFGGGYAMIPLIQSEVVSKEWMSMNDLVNFIAISESTPGPFAVNISTYIGTEIAGFLGALSATFGLVLPSFIIILVIAKFFLKFRENRIVKGCMSGLKPAVVGLIGAAIVSVAKSVLFAEGFAVQTLISYTFLTTIAICLMMLFLEYKKLHPILIILLSAGLGIAAGYAEKLL